MPQPDQQPVVHHLSSMRSSLAAGVGLLPRSGLPAEAGLGSLPSPRLRLSRSSGLRVCRRRSLSSGLKLSLRRLKVQGSLWAFRNRSCRAALHLGGLAWHGLNQTGEAWLEWLGLEAWPGMPRAASYLSETARGSSGQALGRAMQAALPCRCIREALCMCKRSGLSCLGDALLSRLLSLRSYEGDLQSRQGRVRRGALTNAPLGLLRKPFEHKQGAG